MAHEDLRQKQLGQRKEKANVDDRSHYYSLPLIYIVSVVAYKSQCFHGCTGNNQVTGSLKTFYPQHVKHSIHAIGKGNRLFY